MQEIHLDRLFRRKDCQAEATSRSTPPNCSSQCRLDVTAIWLASGGHATAKLLYARQSYCYWSRRKTDLARRRRETMPFVLNSRPCVCACVQDVVPVRHSPLELIRLVRVRPNDACPGWCGERWGVSASGVVEMPASMQAGRQESREEKGQTHGRFA